MSGLDVVGGEPAEGEENEPAAEAAVVGVVERTGRGAGGIDFRVEVVGQALDDGFAPGAGRGLSVEIEGIAVGADDEGVGPGGEHGGEGLEEVGLGEEAGDTGKGTAVRGPEVGVVGGGEPGVVGAVVGVKILVQTGVWRDPVIDTDVTQGAEVVEAGGVDGGLERTGETEGSDGEGGGGAGGLDDAIDEVAEGKEGAALANLLDDVSGEFADVGVGEAAVAGVGVLVVAGVGLAGA